MKLYNSLVVKNESKSESGTIIDVDKNGLLIKTDKDAVLIQEIKPEGKNRMSVKDFLNGTKKEDLINKKFE